MAHSFKVIGGDAPKQRIPLKQRIKVRRAGMYCLHRDILSLRLIESKRNKVTSELMLIGNTRLVIVSSQKAISEISYFAKQSELFRASQSVPRNQAKSNSSGLRTLLNFVFAFIGVAFVLVFVVILGSVILADPSSESEPAPIDGVLGQAQSGSREPSRQRSQSITNSNEKLPSYQVINRTESALNKVSFDIQLETKLSDSEIRQLATHLKSTVSDRVKRVFIVYYLPDMQIGSGAWATSHFTPDLEIKILGMTEGEAEDLLKRAEGEDDSSQLGRWVDNRPYVSSIILLIEQDGQIHLHQYFQDGSELIESVTINGDRYLLESGEYLRINRDGKLEWYDSEGLFLVCEKST